MLTCIRRLAGGAAFLAMFAAGGLGRVARAELLYASDTDAGNITRFSADGTRATFVATGLHRPAGIAFDQEGNLIGVDNLNRSVFRYTVNGTRTLLAFPGLAEPRGLAVDGAGDAYVANFDIGNADASGSAYVEKYTPGGDHATFAIIGKSPWAMTFDKDGNLYASIGWAGSPGIQKITPDGTVSTFASRPGDSPFGLAFDADGNLFMSDSVRRRIVKFTPDGVGSVFGLTTNTPAGLAFDSSGNLFVGTLTGGSIEEFAPDGTHSIFATGLDSPTYLAFGPNYMYFDAIAAGVPEPASLLLLAGGGLALLVRRK